MHLTYRETWALIHGMILGAAFLLSFGGGLAGLYSLKPGLITEQGLVERTRRLILGTWVMAMAAWATVVTGTWIVYPWYRDTAPTSPKSLLVADSATADWHNFGMEWKEHIAWIAPLLATAVAFGVTYYGRDLIRHQGVRKALMVTFVAAFLIAAIAGVLGALITKAAPVH
jgi:ABC-type dipeptide/oligopeptide/nickel transport system permease subunit